MNKGEILQKIHEEWICLIMRGDTAEETLDTIEAAIDGGARVVEAAFTTPEVVKVLGELRRRHGEEIVLSAGTVRTMEQARIAIDCGVDGIVAPNFYPPVMELALEHGKLAVPGCVTPTEIADALRAGADLIKLFPCYPVGADYIRYITAPFPDARIVPAGAITYDNMQEYHAAGAFAVVIGMTTELRLAAAVKARRYDQVAATVRMFLQRAKELGR
jgi:2-dehydro-3-deoxyphosphogluconate aldolase/(4S)-4-hydroxy-2-oxoglutarate aldolase